MAQTLAQKLRIKEGAKLFTLHAPVGFAAGLGAKTTRGKDYDQIHWFVKNSGQVDQEVDSVLALLHDDVLCWIYYPKGTSGIQTDLTRDKGWGKLHGHKDLQWVNLVSYDETWSAFAMRLKTDADRLAKPRDPVSNEYVDRVNKTVRLPEDLEAALQRSKAARTHYDGLSYSCRREYVEWITGAKRPETRLERVKGTVERLEKGWKNPRNI